MENVLIVFAKTHERSKAGETISGLFCRLRAPCYQPKRFPRSKRPLQARLDSLFTCPFGNGCFGTPVYTMVYIFAGEVIFLARKKPVSYLL